LIRVFATSLSVCVFYSECEFTVLTFRFAEQDITGDVLLELDVELLKTEIGVVAFGKRKRIANAISGLRDPPPAPEPESAAHSETLFSHSRNISSTQGSSINSLSLLTSAVPPVSATGSQTLGGLYQSDSSRITEDTYSLSPGTPRSTGPRRESDPGFAQETLELLNRTGSRNSIIGLGIQLTSKFQVSMVCGKVEGKILMSVWFSREPDHRS